MPSVKSTTRKKIILSTALDCFIQFGYAKTSLDVIAQKAGISRPLIYLHFKNKQDLFTAMLEDIFEERYTLAEACIRSDQSKKEKLRELVEVLVLKDKLTASGSFNNAAFLSDIFRILPKFELKYRKRFIEIATQVLGDEALAEVFRFSLGGLRADHPSPSTLRKRVNILIDCLCK